MNWIKLPSSAAGIARIPENLRTEVGRANTREARERFVYALVLCNRTRYPALLWSWAFHGLSANELTSKDADSSSPPSGTVGSRRYGLLRFWLAQLWIDELQSMYVTRRKPGGFVWIDAQLRDNLRVELAKGRPQEKRRLASNIHHCLAEWYHKLFVASRDPMAVFEVAYHRCQAAYLALHVSPATFGKSCQRAVADLREVRVLLTHSKPSLLSRMFSKGKLDRLELIREQYVGDVRRAAGRLCKDCRWEQGRSCADDVKLECLQIEMATHRLSRAIAREVAEHEDAFTNTKSYLEKVVQFRRLLGAKQPAAARISRVAANIETRNEYGTLSLATRSYYHAGQWFGAVFRGSGFPLDGIQDLARRRFTLPDGVIGRVEEWISGRHGWRDSPTGSGNGLRMVKSPWSDRGLSAHCRDKCSFTSPWGK
jgi:hypothetical protein